MTTAVTYVSHYKKKKRRKYKIHYGRIFLALLTFATLITGLVSLTAFLFRPGALPDFSSIPSDFPALTAQIKDGACYNDNLRAKQMDSLIGNIYSACALLTEKDTGRVLYRKAASERAYPASLTKMMTLIVAIESLPDLDEKITLPEEIFTPLYEGNASMAGFHPGESISVRDLLYGTMLPSGADAAVGLACAISGSESAFAQRMNEKAAALGMKNTHFSNCTGLHDDDHWSTAEDMTLLVGYALQNNIFRELFETRAYTTAPTQYYPNGISLTSTMFHKVDSPEIAGRGKLLGGKTGYTGEAGLCLASLAEMDGKEYILVTMGADGNNYTQPLHLLDAYTVYSRVPDFWEL